MTVLVQLPGGTGRAAGGEIAKPTPPIRGSNEGLARVLREYANVGVSHVQLVIDPITVESIETCAAVLEILDRS